MHFEGTCESPRVDPSPPAPTPGSLRESSQPLCPDSLSVSRSVVTPQTDPTDRRPDTPPRSAEVTGPSVGHTVFRLLNRAPTDANTVSAAAAAAPEPSEHPQPPAERIQSETPPAEPSVEAPQTVSDAARQPRDLPTAHEGQEKLPEPSHPPADLPALQNVTPSGEAATEIAGDSSQVSAGAELPEPARSPQAAPAEAGVDPAHRDLFKQEGTGPWLKTYSHGADFDTNTSRRNLPVSVEAPDPQSDLATKRLFYRVPDLTFTSYGQDHHFDMYTSPDMNVAANIEAFPDQPHGMATSPYTVDMGRLRYNAEKGYEGADDARTLLHNVSNGGGKIAYVYAHGGPAFGRWCVFSGTQYEGFERIIQELQDMKNPDGTDAYQAIYLGSCNEWRQRPNIADVKIPVVTNLGWNNGSGNDMAVLLPKAHQTAESQ